MKKINIWLALLFFFDKLLLFRWWWISFLFFSNVKKFNSMSNVNEWSINSLLIDRSRRRIERGVRWPQHSPLVKACASCLTHKDISHSFVHVHIKSTCVEREKRREKKENALFDWKDDSYEGEEMRENEGYLRSKRHTEVFFFYVCGESLSIFDVASKNHHHRWGEQWANM